MSRGYGFSVSDQSLVRNKYNDWIEVDDINVIPTADGMIHVSADRKGYAGDHFAVSEMSLTREDAQSLLDSLRLTLEETK